MKCPECGSDFERLGQHWIYSPSHRPELSEKQKEVIKGLLMGDATYNETRSKNPKITIDSVNKKYLEKLSNIFSKISTGVKKYKTAEQSATKARDSGFDEKAETKNYSDIYRLSTRSHPELKKFSNWYDEGKKFPEDLVLTPTILKHWYVCDGSLQNKQFKISLTNEKENRKKIEDMFERAGLPKPNTWVNKEYGMAIWNKKESEKIFEYIDNMDCYEYKFPKNSS